MHSIAGLLGIKIAVPDFSTLSRRGKGLVLSEKRSPNSGGPVHLVVDSTGLKVFGEGEWREQKHRTKAKRKSWRKLHLGLDLITGDIICSDLTLDEVGDSSALPSLLDQIGGPVDQFLADDAYDGGPTRDLLRARFGADADIIIPPPRNAVPSPHAGPVQRIGIAILLTSKSEDASPGNVRPATRDAAAVKHKWADGST